MTNVGLNVMLGADWSNAEQAMNQFYSSAQALAKNVQLVFANMAGATPNISNAFKLISDGAKNASQVAINESKARQQVDKEETQSALNASRLRIQAMREEQAAQRVATAAKRAEKDLYGQMVADNNRLVRKYYNAAAAVHLYGEESKITAEALEELRVKALEGQEQLKSIEAGAGRFQRNVGNYSGATQYLSQSIAQLSGEIPNFFQSMRIGFMSIGNNIQPIVQGIGLLIKENAALLAQGKATQSILGTVAKSLLGWQTMLLVGVGIISRYGGELIDWATGADKAKAAAEGLRKEQEKFDQITQSSNKSAGDQIAKLEVLNSAMTDSNLSMEQRVRAYNEAKELYPSYLSHLDKDKALNTGIADVIDNQLVPAIMAAAAARAYEGKISEIVTKRIELGEKRKVAAYKKSQAETDKLIASINRNEARNNARAAGNLGVGSSPLMGFASIADAATQKFNEASDALSEIDKEIANNKLALDSLRNGLSDTMESMGNLATDGTDPLSRGAKQQKKM